MKSNKFWERERNRDRDADRVRYIYIFRDVKRVSERMSERISFWTDILYFLRYVSFSSSIFLMILMSIMLLPVSLNRERIAK